MSLMLNMFTYCNYNDHIVNARNKISIALKLFLPQLSFQFRKHIKHLLCRYSLQYLHCLYLSCISMVGVSSGVFYDHEIRRQKKNGRFYYMTKVLVFI